ncbi:MAG: DUF1848 family protein [Desulfobacteraceae bacterium]|nr:MAG: DUF1848 family protein [Desulfobacteraceae bacterium]
MQSEQKIVLSASRRTDIPAFYMDWFMEGIASGAFDVIHPYTRRVTRVPATPDRVHTVVFWSKNFGPFLAGNYGEKLIEKGLHLYFSFTINSESTLLEPNLPPLTDRLAQLHSLSRRFGPACIDWRFDPICFFRVKDGRLQDNLKDFPRISDAAAALGIKRCITSFNDIYGKVRKRKKPVEGFVFVDPLPAEKRERILALNQSLGSKDIRLRLCCEKEVLDSLPEEAGVRKSACIPSRRLKALYGGNISLESDRGQRVKAGCGCRKSIDIGSYDLHPCAHNCLFCYANPREIRS